jgi:uncharacterized membrane protein
MTLIAFLIFIVCFAIVAYAAWWVITKFFSPPMQMPALAVVGLLLLIVLLVQFVPQAAQYRIWK